MFPTTEESNSAIFVGYPTYAETISTRTTAKSAKLTTADGVLLNRQNYLIRLI